jgi:RNA polymerase sigma-54 factor
MLILTPRQLLLAEEFLGNINEEGYLAASLEEILHSVNLLMAGHVRAGEADEDEAESEAAVNEGAERAAIHPAAARPEPVGASAASASPSSAASSSAAPPFYTMPEAEEMLTVIQRLDPSGIGARDLRECLLIQLVELADTSSLSYRLVSEAFPDLIAHRWNDLAKRFGVEPVAVQAAADQLSRLDPKPGLKHSKQSDGYIIPDLIVEKIGGRYQVFLNDTGMPRLRLSRSYQEIARDKKKMTPENREFIASKMNSANWMIQAIEQRRQTMLKVMNFIVDRQRDFFERGVQFLKPLTLREVAEVINMHESTVSRVTNEKYVQTPRGVLPLKFFFSSGLSTTGGDDVSARGIKAQIEKLVSEEDSKNPLTDQAIVNILKQSGVQIARRTVAKYRDQLGVLSARMRKRV